MQLPFYKYEGTGNDFVIIDLVTQDFIFHPYKQLVQKLCNRHLGIGADGLIIIAKHGQYDFEMIHYNADGSQGGLCANGSRCAVHLAQYLGIIGEKTQFLTVDGVHHAKIVDNIVHLRMNDQPNLTMINHDYIIDNGNKHYVKFDKATLQLDIIKASKVINNQPLFYKGGINVNFVVVMEDYIFVRSYEKGVATETLSCGSGVVAAAVAIVHAQGWRSPVAIQTHGGALQVAFEKSHTGQLESIYLIGPTTYVFKGEITVNVNSSSAVEGIDILPAIKEEESCNYK